MVSIFRRLKWYKSRVSEKFIIVKSGNDKRVYEVESLAFFLLLKGEKAGELIYKNPEAFKGAGSSQALRQGGGSSPDGG